MKTRNLVGLEVPVIGMGSASTFDVEDHESLDVRRRIIDSCITSGSTLIDTSPMYGRAEKALGVALKSRVGQFQLATKVSADSPLLRSPQCRPHPRLPDSQHG
jgi:aryl-alcohol dehydrogenase-like predicted oxidoreductase